MTKHQIERNPQVSPALSWHIILLTFVAVCTLFARFFHPNFYGYFEDDFFYYAQVARNIATHHGSSFDGIHATNGYHPLWMLLLVALYTLFGEGGFFFAVQAVSLLALVSFYFGVRRCLHRLAFPSTLVPLTSLLLSLYALLLMRFGMEVTLALPLSIWMLACSLQDGPGAETSQTLRFGALACLTVLARLDGIFLVALVVVAQVLSSDSPWSSRVRYVLWVALCFLPFVGYLLFNLHYFHVLLPVSGIAKQLKPLFPPSLRTLRSMLLPFDRTKAALVYPAFAITIAGLAVFPREWRRLTRRRRALLAALYLFPVLHFGSLSLLSDWTVWPWYFYSLMYPVLASSILLVLRFSAAPTDDVPATARALREPVSLVLYIAVAAYVIFAMSYALFKRPSKTSQLAVFVANFSQRNPGIYAMGDDAGSTAYRSSSPFIQLEGLMMDADYIHLLRQRMPLRDVLRRYGADYYVALSTERKGPCLVRHEPSQAGPHSPTLTGRICAQPLAQDTEDGVSVAIFRASDVLKP